MRCSTFVSIIRPRVEILTNKRNLCCVAARCDDVATTYCRTAEADERGGADGSGSEEARRARHSRVAVETASSA